MGFPWAASSFRHVHMLQHSILHGLQCGHLLNMEHLLLLLLWPWCSLYCFSIFCSLIHCLFRIFCPLLDTFSPRQPSMSDWLSCALQWVCLEPSVSGMGQPKTLLMDATPLAPHYPRLGMKIQYTSHSQVDTHLFCKSL